MPSRAYGNQESPRALWWSPSGGADPSQRGLEVVQADADWASAALVGRDRAVCDAAADRLDRQRHHLGCLFEAEVDGQVAFAHRLAPLLVRGAVDPRNRRASATVM